MQQCVTGARGAHVPLDQRLDGVPQPLHFVRRACRLLTQKDQMRDALEDAIEVLLLLLVDRSYLKQMAGLCRRNGEWERYNMCQLALLRRTRHVTQNLRGEQRQHGNHIPERRHIVVRKLIRRHIDLALLQIEHQPHQRLRREARVRVQYREAAHARLQGQLPQIDAALEAQRIRVRGTAKHQPEQRVLVRQTEHPFADHQALDAHRIDVQLNVAQLVERRELGGLIVRLPQRHGGLFFCATARDERSRESAIDVAAHTTRKYVLTQIRCVFHARVMRQAPVQNRDARLVVLVEERAADQLMGAGQSLGRVVHVAFQVVEYLVGTLQAGRLQRIVAVAAPRERIGAVLEQQLCGFQSMRREQPIKISARKTQTKKHPIAPRSPMLLYRIVQCRLVLYILGIHIRTLADQEHAQLHRLHRVDQTRAAVEVRAPNVRPVDDQMVDHLQIGHEARTAHRRRARIGGGIDAGAVPQQRLHHRQLAGDGGTPQRRHAVHRTVLGHLEEALLLDVRRADGDQVVDQLHVAQFAGDKQRCAAVTDGLDDVAPALDWLTGWGTRSVFSSICQLILFIRLVNKQVSLTPTSIPPPDAAASWPQP